MVEIRTIRITFMRVDPQPPKRDFIPHIFKCNIFTNNCPIDLEFDTVVKNLKQHQKLSMTRLTSKLYS